MGLLDVFSPRARPADAREGSGGALGLEPDLAARVRQIKLATRKLVTSALSGGYRSSFRGFGLEFQEVRAYQPGDDVRRIDWNVTARTGDAFVKTYAEERELTLVFVVDTSASLDVGTRVRTKRSAAAQAVALVAFAAVKAQDRVGLLLFGETPGLFLPAKKGGQHGLRIVREVLAAPVSSRATRLSSALEHADRALRRRGILFVVSDFLANDPADVDWPDRLARLARRHDVVALRVSDPLERALPKAGARVDLVDVESGRTVTADLRSRAQREAWESAAKQRKAAVDAIFARSGVDVFDVDAGSKDLGRDLVAFFRRRALAKGART